MFDIGFSELMVIAVVALIVIGPERLPKVARTLGHLFGRMQRYVNDVKADINREMQFEELKKLQAEMEQTARAIETNVNREVRSAEDELRELDRMVAPASAEAPAAGGAGVTAVGPPAASPVAPPVASPAVPPVPADPRGAADVAVRPAGPAADKPA